MARLCRINCEQQGISYFRFSPEIGEDVGTTEKDNRKLCEIIIRYRINNLILLIAAAALILMC